jgi:hypothetical protein
MAFDFGFAFDFDAPIAFDNSWITSIESGVRF